MKKKMRIVKELGSLSITYDIGEIVQAENICGFYKITPVNRKGPSIYGIPPYYLEDFDNHLCR